MDLPPGCSVWSKEQWAQFHSEQGTGAADADAGGAADTSTAGAGTGGAADTSGTGSGTGTGRRKFSFLDGSFQRELKAQKGKGKHGPKLEEPEPKAAGPEPAPGTGKWHATRSGAAI